MNILFFLIPKDEVKFIYDDFSIRQLLEKLDIYKYSAIPILDREGHYIDTISEGDVLIYLKNHNNLNLKNSENISIKEIEIRRRINSITINSNMEDLLELVLSQNFVPVVDDMNHFIGIITRKAVISHLASQLKGE